MPTMAVSKHETAALKQIYSRRFADYYYNLRSAAKFIRT